MYKQPMKMMLAAWDLNEQAIQRKKMQLREPLLAQRNGIVYKNREKAHPYEPISNPRSFSGSWLANSLTNASRPTSRTICDREV